MGCTGSKPLEVSAEDAITVAPVGRIPITVAHAHGGSMAACHGSTLFVVGGHGLAIVDVSDPAAPVVQCDRIPTGVTTTGEGSRYQATICVHEQGNTVFVGGRLGLAVIDVSSCSAPKVIGKFLFMARSR